MGHSPALVTAKTQAVRFAATNSTVLITGESGVGKEMFAQSIHNLSVRRTGPFVAVNCAALPENLLESELFGYEEGAFTGAKKGGKAGLFEMAHKGTLFLDGAIWYRRYGRNSPGRRGGQAGWVDVTGPVAPDTVFYRAAIKGHFDMVVVMYHDQGHIPLKVLGFETGVNTTVGLPFIRTSVDHGTAFGKAGKGTADNRSLSEAIFLAAKMAGKHGGQQ